MKMITYLFELFLLWSAIYAYDSVMCASVPELRLANGTVLSDYQEVIIEYGDPLELFCTGNATNLQMFKSREKLNVNTVNKTTVRFFAENVEQQDLFYYCEDFQTGNRAVAKVTVESTPLVTDFHCKSKNLDYLNCTWASFNTIPKFSLYYKKQRNNSTFLLCKLDIYDSMYCVWDSRNPMIAYQAFDKKLTFLMETCNYLGCGNQTFVFEHFDILQLDPPKLDLIQKSSHSVSLNWNYSWKISVMNYLNLEHRISYWYSGVHQIEVNTTSLIYMPTSEFKLKLPCAGTFYQVMLSVRPETAVGEEFWSEDAVVSFVTDPEPKGVAAAVDPTCSRPRVTITPEIMLYELEKFRDKMEKEQIELKERISLWKLRIEEDQTNHTFNNVADTAEI